MVDAAQVLYEWLTATGTAMRTAFGTRVWVDEAPASWSNDAAAVIMDVVGAEPHTLADAVNVTVQLTVYSGGLDLSGIDALARTVSDRLRSGRGQSTASGHILYVVVDSVQGATREPESGWPRVVIMATIGVAE